VTRADAPAPGARWALASIVAGLCLIAGLAAIVLLGGGAVEEARAGGQPSSSTTLQHAHPGGLGVDGMNERELRSFETATLGAEHAREHALMRAAMKVTENGTAPEPQPQTSALAAGDPVEETGDPAEVGRWQDAKTALPIVAIHAALLPTGKVMFFSWPTYPTRPNNAEAYLWDPAHPEQPPVLKNPPGNANIWCAGQTFTADGELVVFGGNLDYETASLTWKGLDQVFTFDPFTETWTEQPRMAHGRWYPTGVRMADGRIPIISGLDESGLLDPYSHTNLDVELFTPPANRGGLGSIEKIGETSWTPGAPPSGKPPAGDLYPRMIAMASGRVLLAGPDQASSWYIQDVDADPFTWGDIPAMSRPRTWGTTVPLPSGPSGPSKVMAIAGAAWSGEPSTTTTEVFDENNPSKWQAQPGKDITYGRGHANTVLLPDGSMAEVGGGRGTLVGFRSPHHYALPETRHVELWDPATKTWRLGPAQSESRAYHSTALLLPDGRVMSAGDEFNGDPGDPDKADNIDTDPAEDTAEIYEPPYLFRGPRPTISSAPQAVGFNGSFGVDTPDTNITRAALAAPGAVTHGVDMNQRMLQLDVVQRTGCVDVIAPTGPKAAPPGFYMLFLLNDQGVPSVAKFVELKEGGTLGGCETPPPPDVEDPVVTLDEPQAGTTVAGTIDVAATASDDRGVVRVRFELPGRPPVNDTTSPYSTTWDTTQVDDGEYTLKAKARDAAGNEKTASVTVTVENVDTDGPSVEITTPAPGATVASVIPLSATADDPSGVSDVQFKVDGTNVGGPDTSAPYSVDWGSINVPNGEHTVTAVARDTFGNTQLSEPVEVEVSNEEGEPIDALPPKNPPVRPGPPPVGGEVPVDGGPAGTPGNSAPGPAPAIDLAPAISHLKLSQASFRLGARTRISFQLSETARVVLSFDRKLSGSRRRYAHMKTKMSVTGKLGANSLAFRGRLSRTRVLKRGSYRMTLVATDAAGKRSSAVRASFTLRESLAQARARRARALAARWF
jgi:Domain of unknown function (DUF1929)/Bacterial Ig domain